MALSETFVGIHQTRSDRRGAEGDEEVETARGGHIRGKDRTMSSPNRCYHEAPLGKQNGRLQPRQGGEETQKKKKKNRLKAEGDTLRRGLFNV